MRIGVTGSWRQRDQPGWELRGDQRSFGLACKELGKALARAGAEITVGSDSESTADRYVVEGYLSIASRKLSVRVIRPRRNESPPFHSLYKKFPKVFKYLPGPTAHWRHTRHLLVADIDALVTIGGADGTYQAGLELKLTKKRLVPLAAFGGASARLLTELLLSAPANKREALEALNNPWTRHSAKHALSVVGANQPPKILIVHGHAKDRVALNRWLRDNRLADSILMGEYLSPGETLPEKFEALATAADAAIALATPDDRGVALADVAPHAQTRSRARQNVWVEVGWFWGRLGRSRVLLLVRGDVEIPSDLDGIEFHRYRNSPLERKQLATIRGFLAHVGKTRA